MLADQIDILEKILAIIDARQVDALLVAGDVYDRSVPAAEAVTALDDFLTALAARGIPACLISGNHDSPERLGYASRLLTSRGIHMAAQFRGAVETVRLRDDFGQVVIHLLPFLHPEQMRPFYPEQAIQVHQDAVRAALEAAPIDPRARNVLLAHQFVISGGEEPERCDSETITVGALDQVDASLFDGFDYVALGHLHRAQRVGRDAVRYCGSPLKYSFSEAQHEKSVTLATLGEKGFLDIEEVPLTPLRDMRSIKGPLERLLDPAVLAQGNASDYIRAILTDEDEVVDALGRLRAIYPNLMRLEFDNLRSKRHQALKLAENQAEKSPLELFAEFYALQNNEPMSEEKRRIVREVIACAEEAAQ